MSGDSEHCERAYGVEIGRNNKWGYLELTTRDQALRNER
jgi:hypothetical protein